MCLRIRVLTEEEAESTKPYFLSIMKRDAPGAPVYPVDGVLEWWDGSRWVDVKYVHGMPPSPAMYRVYLNSITPINRVDIIKRVRVITGLGLKEAKDIVDATEVPGPPVLVWSCSTEKAAEDAVKDLRKAGADAHYTACP